MKNYDLNNNFETTDLGLASACVSTGYPISHLDKSNPNRVTFVFKRDPGLDDVIQQYWANQLQVSALLYFQTMRAIKTRIYQE